MLQGVCMDPGQTAVLEKGTSYYLFPNGDNHFYVSKFPNVKAHKGCFPVKRFNLILAEEEAWPAEPKVETVQLERGKVYLAKLIWRKPGYKMTELTDYYIRAKKTHADFFKDKELTQYCGCFPIRWFSNFREIEQEESVQEIPDFDIDFEEKDLFSLESEPKIAKYEQLSIFDF